MAIPVRSKQLRSLVIVDQNQLQTENIIQQLCICEVLKKKSQKTPKQNTNPK